MAWEEAPLAMRGWSPAGSTLAMLALAVLIVGASPGGARAEGAARLNLEYAVYAGGIRALVFESEVDLSADGYSLSLNARSEGLLQRLTRFSLTAESEGAAAPGGLTPKRFRSESNWRTSSGRWVELVYGPDGFPVSRGEPAPEDDDRDPVPAALRRETVDPITALLQVVRNLQAAEGCDATLAVFDGRRRFDVTTRDGGMVELAKSEQALFSGPAQRCLLTLKPVSGFWKGRRADGRTDPKIEVFLAPAAPGGHWIPVRLHADSRFGGVRAHLVSATSQQPAPGQKAAR